MGKDKNGDKNKDRIVCDQQITIDRIGVYLCTLNKDHEGLHEAWTCDITWKFYPNE